MGMTVTEALIEGLLTTVIGLSIVFAVLLILMFVLMLMKVVFYKEPVKAVKAELSVAPAPVVAPVETDDTELIAVLTAAIAASLNTSTYNLRIKSYRRIDTKANAWNNAGIKENINNKTY